MPLFNIDLPPGVVADGQPYEVGTKGRWRLSNLVRWRNGLLQPVGGWVEVLGASHDVSHGPARGVFPWRDNSLNRYLAFGTPGALYVHSDQSPLKDITPDGMNIGRENSIFGAGFGFGSFGMEDFGTIRTSGTNQLDASAWSLDAWGGNLVAMMSSDGIVYEWEPGEAKAVPVNNAPTGLALMVTSERHLVVLGTGQNGRLVAWSDRENNTVWTPVATNLAGDFELRTDGQLITGVRARGENVLITSRDAWAMRFLGAPLVYGFELLGRACGAFSAQSVVSAGSFAAWMGPAGWHIYDGALRPLRSTVLDYVFSDLNTSQSAKVVGGLNDRFNEIWWIYPSADSNEPNRYVFWNYVDDYWAVGELERTSWAQEGVFAAPLLPGVDGKLYQHETGYTANGEPVLGERFVESGEQSIDSGDNVMVVRRLIPDERSLGETRATFTARFEPNGVATEYGPYDPAKLTDMRFQGRQVAVRIEGAADAPWRVGTPRLDIKPGGMR